ncbi:CatB-related O-acetyltransferase [Mariprofundus aestuarium]|nr:CatB-related O-acetyltransferase [Mariprofundus aestuarium]
MSLKYQGVYLAQGSRLTADAEIGFGTRVNGPVVIKGHGKAVIGKYCAIGDGLRVITSNHDLQYLSVQNALQQSILGHHATDKKRDVKIGNDVWIGDGVIILPGVEVGDGAIIGAGAIVTRNVNAYQVSAGNPAKHIKSRFPKSAVELLKDLKWWDWSLDEMRARKGLFEIDFSSLNEQDIEAIKAKTAQAHE